MILKTWQGVVRICNLEKHIISKEGKLELMLPNGDAFDLRILTDQFFVFLDMTL